MVPEYVPGAMLPGKTDTLTVAGVAPLVEDRAIHGASSDADQDSCAPVPEVIVIDFGLGLPPVSLAVKERAVGVTLSTAEGGDTLNCTGTTTGASGTDTTWMEAVYVPAESPDTFADAVRVDGAVPLADDSVSHGASAAAPQIRVPVPPLEIERAMERGFHSM